MSRNVETLEKDLARDTFNPIEAGRVLKEIAANSQASPETQRS